MPARVLGEAESRTGHDRIDSRIRAASREAMQDAEHGPPDVARATPAGLGACQGLCLIVPPFSVTPPLLIVIDVPPASILTSVSAVMVMFVAEIVMSAALE